jgi:hypothetical protein
MSWERSEENVTLFINLRCHRGVFRRFQIVAKRPDEYYGLTPVKGGSTKFSRHWSGQDHIKIPSSKPLGMTQDESSRPDQIEFYETLWFVNLDGPESLMPYDEQEADGVFEVDWDGLKHDEYVYSVEVALGRKFDIGQEYYGEGYLVQAKHYPVPVSESRLSMRLQLVGTPRSLGDPGC